MRQLDTPITQAKVEKQYVSKGGYQLILNANGGIDLNKSYYQYIVTNLPSGEYTAVNILAKDLPNPVKTKIKELHALAISHAENQGLIHPGSDSDDLP